MATKDDQKIKELELLYRVGQILDENMDMRNVLRPVMNTLGEYMGFKHATVTLYNRQTGEISIELATGLSPLQTKVATKWAKALREKSWKPASR